MSDYNFFIKATNGMQFRQFLVDGEEYIGVHGDEPYELSFGNNTSRPVEVRFSIDGTDILTGKPATLELGDAQRWVVQPYRSCELKAWPESQHSGGRFLFTKAESSAAANLHGNVSHLGIIAAAVFVESAQALRPIDAYKSVTRGMWVNCTSDRAAATMGTDGPGTGVGSAVEQHIEKAAGLLQPRLSRVLSLYYMWWDDLQALLKSRQPGFSTVPGFPGAKAEEFRGVDLSGVPRTDTGDGARFSEAVMICDISEEQGGNNPLFETWRNSTKRYGHKWSTNHYTAREMACARWSWAVPSSRALDCIAEYGPIVEMGAGTGYWARLLQSRGVDVVAYDSRRPDSPHAKEELQIPDMCVGDLAVPQALIHHPDRTLFLCWPPLNSSMAADCLAAWSGTTLIYIGEGMGGCTADDRFHKLLEGFDLLRTVTLPNWPGIHDYLAVYRRRAK